MGYIEQDMVILITGATGATGFEIARQAAEAGAVVGIHGSRAETVAGSIERLRKEIPDARLIAAPGAFGPEDAVEAVVNKVASEAGRLDGGIHCAITGAPGTNGYFAKTDPCNYAAMAGLTLAVLERLCFAALPHLARQGGAIVTFALDAGRYAAPRQSILGGVFGGIMAFVRNLAVEVARDNVRVHCISPTYVSDTPIFERHATSGRGETASQRAGPGLPWTKDIAPLALFLCGPDSAKITGQIISVNGGLNA